MNPLTEAEKAYFDTIKSVTRSARPADLSLMRMGLDEREVAVIVQSIIDSETAKFVGYQPLAIIVDDETTLRLRNADGDPPITVEPGGLEGAGESGQALVEWSLIAALVAVVSILALGAIHKAVDHALGQTEHSLSCPSGVLADGTCAP